MVKQLSVLAAQHHPDKRAGQTTESPHDKSDKREEMQTPNDNEGWKKVSRSRQAKTPRAQGVQQPPPHADKNSRVNPVEFVKKRILRTEAIIISNPNEGETYTSVMKRVVASVDLKEVGTDAVVKTRKTKTGAILIEIEGKEKSNKLESILRGAIGDTAKVSRPLRRTPVLLTNVPDWVEADDVSKLLSTAVGELEGETVSLKYNTGGGRVATFEAPMAAALKLAELGALRISWALCRVKLLERKSPTCHRCQGKVTYQQAVIRSLRWRRSAIDVMWLAI